MLETALNYINFGVLLIFGVYISATFIGISLNKKNIWILSDFSALLILLQTAVNLTFGYEMTEKLYPLISHVPVILLLTLCYRRRLSSSVFALTTAYLCCQISKWLGLLGMQLFDRQWVFDLIRILLNIVIAALLIRHIAPLTRAILSKPVKTIMIFSILPIVYYIFDYASTIYTHWLYRGNKLVFEFLPFTLAVVYLIFCILYFTEYEKKSELERQKQIIQIQASQSLKEVEAIRTSAYETSILRHDIKTTLFFCLMNLRFGRLEAAKKWFYEYFKTLDPTMLQQETAILLQSFLNGVFGKDKELEHEVIELIDQWISVINDNEQISNELLNAYEEYINTIHAPVRFNYQAVLQFCVNAKELQQSFFDVSKFQLLLNFVKSLDVEAEAQDDENYKSRIDAILMNLISKYDAEESELKKQQEYFRCIVENEGVIEDAEKQFQAMEDLEKDFNIGKQMIKWAIYDDADVQVKKFGFQNTKGWFKKAISGFDSKMQAAFPAGYTLSIDGWNSISNGNDHIEQTNSLKAYYDNNKFQNMYVNTPNILAVILLILSAGLAFVTLYSLIVTGLAAGFLVFRIIRAGKAYPVRIQNAINCLNACMGEIAEFRRYYDEQRAKKDELLSAVEFL